MKKVWRPRTAWGTGQAPDNLNVSSDLLRQLLIQRGLTGQGAVEKFLAPDYERDLHDPFLMLDMDRAAGRIVEVIRQGERIAIFADYDADGVPGAAALAAFFRRLGFSNFTVYIPDRHDESYGLNNQALEMLAAAGAKLIITIDCGITDIAAVKEANRLGLEVIITDHHLVPETLPPAYAIVNPKRLDDPYPSKMLAGAGVAFKLVQALVRKWDNAADSAARVGVNWEKWLLDLVAIATVSDQVPLTGENRALVFLGLKVLRRTPRLGLRQLFKILKLNSEFITEDDIGFLIGPRLNSASRMSHGQAAYELLTTDDEGEAVRLVRHLEEKNQDRRDAVTAILDRAAAKRSEPDQSVVFVAGDRSWPLGVLGLAASRLAEESRRPVFLWGENGRGEIKGSCRSDGTVNIVELMKRADKTGGGLFLNYGGHEQAGGFSLRRERLPELVEHLSAAYLALEKLPTSNGDLFYDWELPIDDVTIETHSLLERLAPFGPENPKPVFLLPQLSLISSRTFGRLANHLEMFFCHPNLGQLRAVRFFAPPLTITKGESLPLARTHLDILATLEKSYYRSVPEFRLRIVDWRESV